ncbi:MAG: DUF1573 domain-containing protein [Tannerella sp.]|jgi:hypothetical protein|nr:DUF1573 domain-containing protein [Tannerella sp.]
MERLSHQRQGGNARKCSSLLPCFFFLCAGLFAGIGTTQSQNKARIEVGGNPVYNFGPMVESEQPALHEFTVKNTGSAPLVISRITTSCGCTQPQWTRTAIAPGAKGVIKISYRTWGNVGPFRKNIEVYSNAENRLLRLYIEGSVSRLPEKPVQVPVVYAYNIGALKTDTKSLSFPQLYPGDTAQQVIHLRNEGKTVLHLQTLKMPAYLQATFHPSNTLQPGEEGQILLTFLTDKLYRMGHVDASFTLAAGHSNARKKESPIRVEANIINNYKRLSEAQRAEAPAAVYAPIQLDFGQLPAGKKGFMALFGQGSKATKDFNITNRGKSALWIYSLSCDDKRLHISGGKEQIAPGESTTYKLRLDSREVKTRFEATLTIVSNDPVAPIRLLKVTAKK